MAYMQHKELNKYLIPDISNIITEYCLPTIEETKKYFEKCLSKIDKDYDKNMAKKRRTLLLNKLKHNHPDPFVRRLVRPKDLEIRVGGLKIQIYRINSECKKQNKNIFKNKR